MGTFAGHILPGVFFGFFGLWWSFVTAIRYVQSKMRCPDKKNKLKGYHSSVTMPCICFPCRRLPIESFIKIFFCSVGVIGEVVTGIHLRTVPKHKTYTTHGMDMSHDHGEHEHMHKRDISNLTTSISSTTKPEMIEEVWFLPGK